MGGQNWVGLKTKKNNPVKGWGGLSKMSKNVKMSIHTTTHTSIIFKENWIIFIRLQFIWLFTYPWVEESPQISNLQTDLNYLNWFKTYWTVTNLGVTQLGGWLGGWNWVGVSSQNKNLQTELNYLNKAAIYLISDLTWPHPLTHTITHPSTHPKVGVSPQTINLQAELNYLN